MIPAAYKLYYTDEDRYFDWLEFSYPHLISDYFYLMEHIEQLDVYISKSTYLHCNLPTLLGIRDTYKGSPPIQRMEEMIFGSRSLGVSIRCKFMV